MNLCMDIYVHIYINGGRCHGEQGLQIDVRERVTSITITITYDQYPSMGTSTGYAEGGSTCFYIEYLCV
jgi:hypothetical protein